MAYLASYLCIVILKRAKIALGISCIRKSLEHYDLDKPEVDYYCSLRAALSGLSG